MSSRYPFCGAVVVEQMPAVLKRIHPRPMEPRTCYLIHLQPVAFLPLLFLACSIKLAIVPKFLAWTRFWKAVYDQGSSDIKALRTAAWSRPHGETDRLDCKLAIWSLPLLQQGH